MLSLQEISDRLEIGDLLVRYTAAIDAKRWELLDDVFLPDALIDYTTSGGIKGRYPEVRKWLEQTLAHFEMTQHLISNTSLELNGDSARSRTMFYNPMGSRNAKDPKGKLDLFWVGGYYVDELRRTPAGWRIAERFEETSWMQGGPPADLFTR